MDESLARELIAMAEEDQRVRAELAADGSLFEGYHPRMEEVHLRNAARLEQVIDAHGWPSRAHVGEQGARAAWLIAQHAISRPHLQRRVLQLLQQAPDVPPFEVAMLEDRIRTFEGRPQLYGTQFDWDEQGELNPLPIEDPEHVDERRRTAGMGPLSERISAMRESVARDGELRPRDWQQRQRDFEAWAKKVGWRE